jgi:hypothetical protein
MARMVALLPPIERILMKNARRRLRVNLRRYRRYTNGKLLPPPALQSYITSNGS